MSSEIQAIIFKKPPWTIVLCRKFLKKHKMKAIKKVHKTKNYLRYRLYDPKKYKRMRTKVIKKWGLNLIIGFIK